MAKKYTPEIKEKVLQYLQDGKSYDEIKKETGISKTTIWILKQKARKNELKTKYSVNSTPRDILEEAINIAEINCDNNENQNYKEEFLNQQKDQLKYII
ncbi:helix-turn-helix domain-containing protein [Spiroplasma ixodetis]|uniref:Transposase n=1 Tax=Spiroplasma ixodetis TaxID=2141 RepID=A0ABN7BUM7_9MOLU